MTIKLIRPFYHNFLGSNKVTILASGTERMDEILDAQYDLEQKGYYITKNLYPYRSFGLTKGIAIDMRKAWSQIENRIVGRDER